jgi:hypothetical protein
MICVKLASVPFRDHLHPDDKMRHVLEQQGDDGTAVRKVDHLAYFADDGDLALYSQFVTERGYVILDPPDDDAIAFTKESSVIGVEFEAEIEKLRTKAIELDGQYDGWGCTIVPG